MECTSFGKWRRTHFPAFGPSPYSPSADTAEIDCFFFPHRAAAKEYDAWATLGNPGWTWSSVNAHINAVEDFYPYIASLPNTLFPAGALRYEAIDDPANHGNSGPIQVSYSNFWRVPEPVIPAYLNTLASLGVPRNAHAVRPHRPLFSATGYSSP